MSLWSTLDGDFVVSSHLLQANSSKLQIMQNCSIINFAFNIFRNIVFNLPIIHFPLQQRNKIITYHCIKNMSNWTESNNALQKTFTFKSFGDAMAWMIKASYIIEKMEHHPEWTNIYNKVHVRLTTHDAGNTITDKDRLLAAALDEVV
jgi:4a-hydroxytetrahydrobiopterin dehydratase